MIKLGNVYYFITIASILVSTILIYFIFRKCSIKVKKGIVFSILIANFILHFIKILFPPYSIDLDHARHHLTFENICAVTTIIGPFMFLFVEKKNPIQDYMLFITFMGGLLGMCIPTFDSSVTKFDMIRYYICHGGMFACSVLTALFGIRRPILKHFWAIPLGFLGYQTIIFLNELFCYLGGLLPDVTSWDVFFDSNLNNNSFTFGVTPDFGAVKNALMIFVPKFMRTVHNGYDSCWPVIWLLGPSTAYFIPIYLFIFSPYFICDKIKNKRKTN